MPTHSKCSFPLFPWRLTVSRVVPLASHLLARESPLFGSFLLARPSAARSNPRCVAAQFPEGLAAVMASPGRRWSELVRAVLGFWQLGPVAAREWATRFPSLLGCQWRGVSYGAGAAFSGPLLASASRRYGQNSALDRFLGLSQPDSSLTPRVPAVSMHRGKVS